MTATLVFDRDAPTKHVMSPSKAQLVMIATIGAFVGISFAVMQLFNPSIYDAVKFLVALLIFPALALLSITLYAHRDRTHGAIVLHYIVGIFCRSFIGILGMKVWEWVAVHAVHHRYSDTRLDPHSPRYAGFWKVYAWTAGLFNRAKKNHPDVVALIEKAQAVLDWWDRHIFKRAILGPTVVLPLLQLGILYLSFGWSVNLLWVLFAWPMAIVIFLWGGGSVNAVSHTAEERDPETNDYSVNTAAVLRPLTAGEFNHHDHHLDQTKAKFGKYWWNDLGYVVFRILRFFGLAKFRKEVKQDQSPTPGPLPLAA